MTLENNSLLKMMLHVITCAEGNSENLLFSDVSVSQCHGKRCSSWASADNPLLVSAAKGAAILTMPQLTIL